MMCHLYINVICTLNFNIRLYCNGQFYEVNVNLKYPSNFLRMEEIDLNQILYKDIGEVSDEERDMEYTLFENDYEMQRILGFQTLNLIIFNFYLLLGIYFHTKPIFV